MKINLVLLIFALFLVGCGKSEKQIAEEKVLAEAISALDKLAASTQVGVNYQQYGNLLIDAKAKVNDATSKTSNNEIKKNLEETMQAYTDAATFWSYKIKDINPTVEDFYVEDKKNQYKFSPSDNRLMSEIVDKYKLKVTESVYAEQKTRSVDSSESIQACWVWASTSLSKVKNDGK